MRRGARPRPSRNVPAVRRTLGRRLRSKRSSTAGRVSSRRDPAAPAARVRPRGQQSPTCRRGVPEPDPATGTPGSGSSRRGTGIVDDAGHRRQRHRPDPAQSASGTFRRASVSARERRPAPRGLDLSAGNSNPYACSPPRAGEQLQHPPHRRHALLERRAAIGARSFVGPGELPAAALLHELDDARRVDRAGCGTNWSWTCSAGASMRATPSGCRGCAGGGSRPAPAPARAAGRSGRPAPRAARRARPRSSQFASRL